MKKAILIIFFILSLNFVFAEQSYPNFGGENSDFFSDSLSLFNENIDFDEISSIIAVSDPQFMPLVVDLDNDGKNEIIVLAGGTLGIYQANQTPQGVNLDILGGYTTNATKSGDFWSNIITYDIDNDNLTEVIFHSQELGYLFIIKWNGSEALNIGYPLYTFWDSTENSADSMVGCGSPYGCVLVSNDKNGDGTSQIGYNEIFINVFNSTSAKGIQTVYSRYYSGSPYSDLVCFSKFKSVPYGNNKYYFTMLDMETLLLFDIEVLSNQSVIYDTYENPHTHVRGGFACSRGITEITSPLLMDFSKTDTGDEIIFGYAHDSDEFKLVAVKKTMTEYDEYPENKQADGILLSNPFKSNAFIDSQESSVCVAGYERTQGDYGRLDFLCADVLSSNSGAQKSTEFIYDFTTAKDYNITANDLYTISAHSIKSKQNDRSQLLTPFGVFDLEDRSEASLLSFCKLDAKCDATLIYDTPLDVESAIISADILKIGYEDLLALTDTNLYYIDDGFINKNAYLGYCTKIQPSINSVWQIHIADTTEEVYFNTETINLMTSFSIPTGVELSGSYVDTWLKDGSEHEFREAGQDLSFRYYVDSCEGLAGNTLSIYGYWDSEDSADYLDIEIYNYNTSSYEDVGVLTASGSASYYNYSLGLNLSDYISGSNEFRFRFRDQFSSDSSNSHMYVDYMSVICRGQYQNVTTWSNKTNEVKIRVKPIDPEGDSVSARVVLYEGEENEQDSGWSDSFASGTEIPFSGLYPNVTTSSSTLRIYFRDSINYLDNPSYQDFNFIVQSEGHIWSDSDSCSGVTPEEYEQGQGGVCSLDSDCPVGYECIDDICYLLPDYCDKSADCPDSYFCNSSDKCEALPDADNNKINGAVKEMSAITGVPISVLILIILGVLIYYIYKEPQVPNNVKLPISIILLFLTIGIFVLLELINFVWIILIVFLLLGIVSISVSRFIGGMRE